MEYEDIDDCALLKPLFGLGERDETFCGKYQLLGREEGFQRRWEKKGDELDEEDEENEDDKSWEGMPRKL